MDVLELAQTDFTPRQMLQYGERLLADAHKEYLDSIEDGFTEGDAFSCAFDRLNCNFDYLAVIWAAGAVHDALECEDVREAIEEAICFG